MFGKRNGYGLHKLPRFGLAVQTMEGALGRSRHLPPRLHELGHELDARSKCIIDSSMIHRVERRHKPTSANLYGKPENGPTWCLRG